MEKVWHLMANIQDVATLAGVSISTVSRVLNGTAQVTGDVRARVETAMQELHYQPSPAARSLRRNRSNIIGLLVSDLQNPFFMNLIQGVEDTAQRNGYSVILCNSREDSLREQQYLKVLYAERVSGAILIPTRENLGSTLKGFHERHIPLVAVDRRIKDTMIDAVLVDNVRGAREAVNHLIGNGYRRIGIITGPPTITTARERLTGYRQALLEAGISPDPALERSGAFREANGSMFTEELLHLTPAIDALFVANSIMTLEAFKTLLAHQIRVPDDLALVGYDETPWADLSSVSLTTVMQPIYELGCVATQRLFQHLQDSTAHARQEILLTPTLHVRASSSRLDVANTTG